MRDIETIDSELPLVATLRRAARERSGPLPSIAVADALLDERLRLRDAAALREPAADALATADAREMPPGAIPTRSTMLA